jgi:pilus assembly protein FimV
MGWKQYYLGALLSLSLIVSIPSTGLALSMGELQVDSQLGEAFLAEIPLTLRTDEIPQELQVSVGLPDDYWVLELERALAVSSLDIEVVGDDARRTIRIRSREPFKEPFFNLLIKTAIGRGSYLRNFPVFLDIVPEPVKQEKPQDQNIKTVVVTMPQPPVVMAAPVAQPESVTYGPVRRDETLSSIARKIKTGKPWSLQQIAIAFWKKNRSEFRADNMSGLRLGATLSVPSADEIEELSTKAATAEFQRQWLAWQASTGMSSPATRPDEQIAEEATAIPPPATLPKKVIAGKPTTTSADLSKKPPAVTMNLTVTPGKAVPEIDGGDTSSLQQPEAGIVLAKDSSPLQIKSREEITKIEKQANREELELMRGQFSQLTGQVSQLTGTISQLTSQLKVSEKSRQLLQNRLAQIEARLSKVQASKVAVNPESNSGWDNIILYSAAGGLVAALVGLLLWLGRSRKEEPVVPQADLADSTMVATGVTATEEFPDQEIIEEPGEEVEVQQTLQNPAEDTADLSDTPDREITEIAEDQSEDQDVFAQLQNTEDLELTESLDEKVAVADLADISDEEIPEIAEDVPAADLADISDEEIPEIAEDVPGDMDDFTLAQNDEQSGLTESFDEEEMEADSQPLEFTPAEPTPVFQDSGTETDGLETVAFIPVDPIKQSTPPSEVSPTTEPLETLEFTLADPSKAPVAKDDEHDISDLESEPLTTSDVDATDELVMESNSGYKEEAVVKQPPVETGQEEDELVLEIEFDLEESGDSPDKK